MSELSDEQLREWRDDPANKVTLANISKMAAELITLRARVAQLEADALRLFPYSERLAAKDARVAQLEAALGLARPFVEAETDEDLYAELGGPHAAAWQERGREAYRALAAIDSALTPAN